VTHTRHVLRRLRGSAYVAYHVRGQARVPFGTIEAIERAQTRRVRRMVAHAYRTVPYYRETMDRIGLRPGDLRTAADLARLPLIEPGQVQRDPEYFVSSAQPLDRYLKLRSGGSTGSPRTVYHDAAALLQNAAHGERNRSLLTSLLDRSLGYRVTVFAPPFSSYLEVQQFSEEHTLIPTRARIQRQYLSVLDPPEETLPLLNDFKPDHVIGYGSYLDIVAAHLVATNAPFHRPRAVLYGGDNLSTAARNYFAQTLGIPVFSTYQAIEAFKIGFECERHAGLHLNVDLYPVRIVDDVGRSLGSGERGDVVVSNLVNRATVLLNYRLGDLAALLPDPCPCGRALPLLSFPLGRSDDLIELPSGRIVHPQAIRTLFTDEERIWQYQVVQRTETHFRVAVVADQLADRREMAARIVGKFAARFGDEITVEVVFEPIERTAGGKIRPVLSLRKDGWTDSSPGPWQENLTAR
jgi:phenylacetate-CoA ligase